MRILCLCHSFNSLSQRIYVALRAAGHDVSVEFDINDDVTLGAVQKHDCDLIVAPFLKRAIPREVWQSYICLIVHPGVAGDRGPSSLDWAIREDEPDWGVTVLQANEVMDGGDVWATRNFPMRTGTKASLYRREVSRAAVAAVLDAVGKIADGKQPVAQSSLNGRGRTRPLMRRDDRRIDWACDDTHTVLQKIRAADGVPGVRDTMFGRSVSMFDARAETQLHGPAGRCLARSGPAICRATRDGAVWIGHVIDHNGPHAFKLPARTVFAAVGRPLSIVEASEAGGYRDLWIESHGAVNVVHFAFYNGAMSTEQCERLRAAFAAACTPETRAVVLAGGPDFWSNGMHLNLIEAAASPADASWANINAIDDLARDIINCRTHLTIAALQGNAGAGGVFLARAADVVLSHEDVVLNPHYKDMGNLYGSEYWTYLLPRYCGEARAHAISQARLPMGAHEAHELQLIDGLLPGNADEFLARAVAEVARLAAPARFGQRLADKLARRDADEARRPLEDYRRDELAHMHRNFYGFDPSYHIARYNFVHKIPKSRTPLTLASHRRRGAERAPRSAAQ